MNAVSLILTAMLLMMGMATAMAQNGSPCNEGRDPVHEPRNPYAICLPEIGRMDDFQGPCSIYQGGGQFGNQLAAVGDVDNSGTVDIVVGHRLCDSSLSLRAEELLLYKGANGGLPSSSNGWRIGPAERNSITKFIAAGDWDDDGKIDIAVSIKILGDTAENNIDGYEIARLVVFWGTKSGTYSLNDTTHLSSDANMWIGIGRGIGMDLNNDHINDLLVSCGSGFSNGKLVPVAQWRIYKGRKNERWGHNGTSYTAHWRWWGGNSFAPTLIDQDGDGNKDLVWNGNDGDRSFIAVLYRSSAEDFPDTNSLQTISVGKAGPAAGWSLLSDVTGDSIPEILANSIVTNEIKVYIGLKGQRLLEQFGSGNDSAQPGNEKWWGKPWATIWTPNRINSNWFEDVQLFDLGDANLDGINDIFAFSWPYVLAYNGGEKMDSLVDALINITPGTELGILKRLGDIDGSGRDIIALTTGNEIRFYAPTKDISSLGISRRLPPGTGKAAVEERRDADDPRTLLLVAIPNPSQGEVQFTWSGPNLNGPAAIIMYDIVGREVARYDARASNGTAQCAVHHLPAGIYLAQFQCDDRTTSTTVVIR